MKEYLINTLDIDGFSTIITLIDYEAKITDTIRSIKIPSCKNQKILVDTALASGMNNYRFISTEVNSNGEIDLNTYKYVNVTIQISQFANEILRKTPDHISNSILTVTQKNKLIMYLM